MEQGQPILSQAEQQVIQWGGRLGQWIHIATRWVFIHNNEGRWELKATFASVGEEGRDLFEVFAIGLKKQLTETQNSAVIGIDLKFKFLVGIRHYYEWYETHKEHRDFFGPDNHYDMLYSLAESTEHEILKFFPQFKALPAPVFTGFTDKLLNGFTVADLDRLLIHVLMKNSDGQTLKFDKYLIHKVIEELIAAGYFTKGSIKADFLALCRFLGLPETFMKKDYGISQKEEAMRSKARTYLKKEAEKKSSNSVP